MPSFLSEREKAKNTKRCDCFRESVPVKKTKECITEKNDVTVFQLHVPIQCTSNIQIFFYIIACNFIGLNEKKKF